MFSSDSKKPVLKGTALGSVAARNIGSACSGVCDIMRPKHRLAAALGCVPFIPAFPTLYRWTGYGKNAAKHRHAHTTSEVRKIQRGYSTFLDLKSSFGVRCFYYAGEGKDPVEHEVTSITTTAGQFWFLSASKFLAWISHIRCIHTVCQSERVGFQCNFISFKWEGKYSIWFMYHI